MSNNARLGDIAKIYSGGTPSRANPIYWGGDIPWIKTTQIQNCLIAESDIDEWITEEGLKHSSAKPVPKGSILMAMIGQGKTRGQVAILNIEATTNQNAAAIKLNDGYDRDYIFQQMLFRYEHIRNISNASGQQNLNLEIIRSIVLPVPPLPEQTAIADLLSTWDAAIDKTEKLIAAKGNRLTDQIQKLIGRRAIKEKEWLEVNLGDLFTEVTRKVGEKELAPYSISAGIGFVSQREKWGKNISGAQHKNYTHLKAGEFAYNKGNSKRYKQGCIYLLKEGEICVPNVFISFKPKAKNIVAEFYEHYFIADYHARELKRYITSGVRSDGLLNLNKKDFFKIMVPCPPVDEQKAVAETLTTLQQEIDLLKQLAEKYKTQKRGLMQRMLVGTWRVKPEIVKRHEATQG